MVNESLTFNDGLVQTINKLVSGVFSNIIIAIIIALIGFIIGKIVGKIVQKVLNEFHVDEALKKSGVNVSIEHLLGNFLTYFIYFISLVMAMNQVGLTTIILNMISGGLILLMILSVILAIKDFVPNVVAGTFIYRKGIVKKGNIIAFDDVKAKVIETTLIETKLESQNKDIIYVPNSLLAKKAIRIIKKK